MKATPLGTHLFDMVGNIRGKVKLCVCVHFVCGHIGPYYYSCQQLRRLPYDVETTNIVYLANSNSPPLHMYLSISFCSLCPYLSI